MVNEIILIGNIQDLEVIPDEFLKNDDRKIFSFSMEVHTDLQSREIKHEMADNLLSQEERFRIFDKMVEFRSWHLKLPSNDYDFEGVNILHLFDTQEFQSYLMPILINLITIKRIIELEKPLKIIATNSLSKLIQSVIVNTDIKTQFFQSKIQPTLFWDKITIKCNIGRIPLTFSISRSNYVKIKNLIESLVGFFYNFWFNINSTKKSIIFLEFNPESFSKLFQAMKNYDGNVVIVNQRRSPIWSKKSFNTITSAKCKILRVNNVLNKEEKNKIPLLVDRYSKKIEQLWKDCEFFNNIFQIEGFSFWNVIKDVVAQTYSKRLAAYITLIYSVKKIFEDVDIRCIVSLNEVGETEKAFLAFNKKQAPSILLEHGFIERIAKTKRFDVLSNYDYFNDKTAVWGEMKKAWLINQYNIDPQKIIVTGSPRHDDYFFSRSKKNNKEKILLLAPNPISDVSGLATTDLKLRVNNIIIKIIESVKKFDNVKIIVKLHPIQLKHNEEMTSFIKKLEYNIPIYLWSSVIDTINSADAVIVISPEIHGTSTMLLESMILGKPTMNVYFDEIPEYEHVRNRSVLTITDNDDMESNLKKILFDEEFQSELKANADDFVAKFMSYRGTASEKFASVLQSY